LREIKAGVNRGWRLGEAREPTALRRLRLRVVGGGSATLGTTSAASGSPAGLCAEVIDAARESLSAVWPAVDALAKALLEHESRAGRRDHRDDHRVAAAVGDHGPYGGATVGAAR
jgi:hypothetical protein